MSFPFFITNFSYGIRITEVNVERVIFNPEIMSTVRIMNYIYMFANDLKCVWKSSSHKYTLKKPYSKRKAIMSNEKENPQQVYDE